jgi:hypothetical protein
MKPTDMQRKDTRPRRGRTSSLALCLDGRRTISRAICVLGRQFRHWTAKYRLFSRCRWQPQALFDALLDRLPGLLSSTQPRVVALDDTPCRKTGKRIRAAKMLRDPLSPPFHTNLCRALRFLQAVLLMWPADREGLRVPFRWPSTWLRRSPNPSGRVNLESEPARAVGPPARGLGAHPART